MSRQSPKQELIGRLIAAFRDAGNHDAAFEEVGGATPRDRRGDMRCLNAIENAGGLTAGELPREVGVTTGAVTGALDRLKGWATRGASPIPPTAAGSGSR